MKIQFNRHEMLVCDIFGSIRRKNAMQFNNDRQVSKQDPYDMDIDGFMGEFAVAKYLNVMVDTSINEKKNPTDLVWKDKTIDVKATRNPSGDIWITEYHRKSPCDLYIQTVIDGDTATITGWIDSKTLFEVAELITNNNRQSYKLCQKDLFPIEMLYVPK